METIKLDGRNKQIFLDIESGMNAKDAAEKYSLSHTRINQIYLKYKNIIEIKTKVLYNTATDLEKLYAFLKYDEKSYRAMTRKKSYQNSMRINSIDELLRVYKVLGIEGFQSIPGIGPKISQYILECINDYYKNTKINLIGGM